MDTMSCRVAPMAQMADQPVVEGPAETFKQRFVISGTRMDEARKVLDHHEESIGARDRQLRELEAKLDKKVDIALQTFTSKVGIPRLCPMALHNGRPAMTVTLLATTVLVLRGRLQLHLERPDPGAAPIQPTRKATHHSPAPTTAGGLGAHSTGEHETRRSY